MKKINNYIFSRIILIIAIQSFLILYKGLDASSFGIVTLINITALMCFSFIISAVTSRFKGLKTNILLFIFDSFYLAMIVLITKEYISPFIVLMPVYIYFTSISLKKTGLLLSTLVSIALLFLSRLDMSYALIVSALLIMFAIVIRKKTTEKEYLEPKMLKEQNEIEKLKLVNTIASVMAHEIKNPVSSIAGVWELIKTDKDILKNEKDREKLLSIIERESLRLTNLVDEFLAYSAPEKRRDEEINLNILVQSVCDSIRTNMDFITKGLSLDFLPHDRKVMLRGDYQRVEQALGNIFINSIHASHDKGRITCSMEVKRKEAVIKITNYGDRISNSHKSRIFEPFFTTKEKGTGLGLAIARNIILAHGGNIEVLSSDKETVFRIGVRI